MDISPKNLASLFDQLGLPNDEASVERFIAAHCILEKGRQVWDAPFWSPSQATFLREAWEADADWVEAVDGLAQRLYRC